MYLATCTGCKYAGDCQTATSLRQTMKGLGVRSMKFACAKKEPVFRPGQAVKFMTFAIDGHEEGGPQRVLYAGYVVKQIGSKVLGFIRPGSPDLYGESENFCPRGNGYVKIPLARVEPDSSRPFVDERKCEWCGNHPQMGAPCLKDANHTPLRKCICDRP